MKLYPVDERLCSLSVFFRSLLLEHVDLRITDSCLHLRQVVTRRVKSGSSFSVLLHLPVLDVHLLPISFEPPNLQAECP